MSILLSNGWVSGDTVPASCSPGISPDFLDSTSGALYSCVGGEYLPVTPIANGGVLETRSVTVFNFKTDAHSQGQSDPGTGKIRWNTVGQIDATEMYFDRLTTDGFDITLQLLLLGPASRLVVQAKDFALDYQLWSLASGVVKTKDISSGADFFIATVTLIESSGNAVFKHNEAVAMLR